MRSPLIIGTRGSDLARWQAEFVKSQLQSLGVAAELKIIRTQGDVMQDLSPDKMEGKGFFTKEIEDALLSNETDIAVHSFKDLPTDSPQGLTIAAVSDREDPSELLLIRKNGFDPKKKFGLRLNCSVGTSSARRKSQLLAYRPDIKVADIRGNVPTRIRKLSEGLFDAILIARAGVERLSLDVSEFHSEFLDPKEFIPAPAQGVLAIQIREGDKELRKLLTSINQPLVQAIVTLERKVLNLFQGGCQTPVGVYAEYDEDTELFSVRIAKAKSWNSMPITLYAESKSPDQLAARIIEKINTVRHCRVFITRAQRKESFLRTVLEGNGFSLEERALIEIIPVPYNSIPDCEWVFFSSKHAVKYFFDQNPVLDSQRLACVGRPTADALRKYGRRADFIGASNDTRMTGKQFASLAGASKVLFPQAKGSLRSIQQQFVKKENVFDLVVYESKKKNEGAAPDAEIIVFTSPSNVEAWFENYGFRQNQKAVAMGDATANALRQMKVMPVSLADAFDDAGLARAVFGASTQT